MAQLVQDLQYAVRSLRRQWSLTTAAILTLAFGVGISTAVLSIVHAALLQPTSYPHQERLADVLATRFRGERNRFGMTPADYLAYRDRNGTFEHFGGYYTVGAVSLTGQGPTERLRHHLASAGFFRALGVSPLHGRTFVASEETAGHDRVAVLAYNFWSRRFNSDPSVVGSVLTLDGTPYEVVGVMPRGFGALGGPADLWLPLSFGPERPADRGSSYLGAVGRLKEGVSFERAEADLNVIAGALEAELPDSNEELGASVRPLAVVMTQAVRPIMLLLLGAASFLVLVACVNVASLQLTRGLARSHEFALRAAIGAGRWSLVRLILLESLLLAGLGSLLGLALAAAGLRLLPDLRGIYLFDYASVEINGWVLALVLVVMTVVTLLVGLLPTLQVSRPDLNQALNTAGTRTLGGGSHQRVLKGLVVVEMASAVVLLVGAGLLVRSLYHLQGREQGFETSGLLTLQLSLPASAYPDPEDHVAYFGELLSGLRALPGVTAAAVSNLPPGRGWGMGAYLEGRDPTDRERSRFLLVSPDFFETAGIPVLQGRTFTAHDTLRTRPVVVVNQLAAEAFFPDQDPIGRRVGIEGPDDWHEVIGVVGNVYGDPMQEQPSPATYASVLQKPLAMERAGDSTMTFLMRAAGSPAALAPAARQVVEAIDPNVPASNVRTMEERLAADIARPRLNMTLVSAFALLSLALAAVGIFGVLSYNVRQRTTEIGLRMAMGADRGRVLRTVLRQGALLAAAGTVAGLLAAIALRRVVAGLLFGVSPFDAATYASVAGLVFGVALASCYLPARRAAHQEPASALCGQPPWGRRLENPP